MLKRLVKGQARPLPLPTPSHPTTLPLHRPLPTHLDPDVYHVLSDVLSLDYYTHYHLRLPEEPSFDIASVDGPSPYEHLTGKISSDLVGDELRFSEKALVEFEQRMSVLRDDDLLRSRINKLLREEAQDTKDGSGGRIEQGALFGIRPSSLDGYGLSFQTPLSQLASPSAALSPPESLQSPPNPSPLAPPEQPTVPPEPALEFFDSNPKPTLPCLKSIPISELAPIPTSTLAPKSKPIPAFKPKPTSRLSPSEKSRQPAPEPAAPVQTPALLSPERSAPSWSPPSTSLAVTSSYPALSHRPTPPPSTPILHPDLDRILTPTTVYPFKQPKFLKRPSPKTPIIPLTHNQASLIAKHKQKEQAARPKGEVSISRLDSPPPSPSFAQAITPKTTKKPRFASAFVVHPNTSLVRPPTTTQAGPPTFNNKSPLSSFSNSLLNHLAFELHTYSIQPIDAFIQDRTQTLNRSLSTLAQQSSLTLTHLVQFLHQFLLLPTFHTDERAQTIARLIEFGLDPRGRIERLVLRALFLRQKVYVHARLPIVELTKEYRGIQHQFNAARRLAHLSFRSKGERMKEKRASLAVVYFGFRSVGLNAVPMSMELELWELGKEDPTDWRLLLRLLNVPGSFGFTELMRRRRIDKCKAMIQKLEGE